MKAYMRFEGGTVECPPLLQVNSDCAHRDEIGEIVSSILLKGFQKLQITIPLSLHKNESIHDSWGPGGGEHFTLG